MDPAEAVAKHAMHDIQRMGRLVRITAGGPELGRILTAHCRATG